MDNKLFNYFIFLLAVIISSYIFYYIYKKIELKKYTKDQPLAKFFVFLFFFLLGVVGIIVLGKLKLLYEYDEKIREVISGVVIGSGIMANLGYHDTSGKIK